MPENKTIVKTSSKPNRVGRSTRETDDLNNLDFTNLDRYIREYNKIEATFERLNRRWEQLSASEKRALEEEQILQAQAMKNAQDKIEEEAKLLGISEQGAKFRRETNYNQQEGLRLAQRQVELAEAEYRAIQKTGTLKEKQDAKEKLLDEQRNLKEKRALSRVGQPASGAKTGIGRITQEMINSSNNPDSFQNVFGSYFKKETEALGAKVSTPITAIAKTVGGILDVVVASSDKLNQFVDSAANYLSKTYGVINANLDGFAENFDSIANNATDVMGLSQFVKQTDYLSNIAALTSQGIAFDIEQRALLETIKDKTNTTFSATEKYLLRLIRLQEEDLTASQFGLEAILRRTLNQQFGDTAYLNDLFDSVTGSLTDISTKFNGDITSLNSVVNTWLGAMYESGMDSSIIDKLAKGVNYLGSGNVQALAGDADLQRLMLLSMDRIGLDYADVLQNGLTASDTNNLMKAIVEYLAQIAKSTDQNNVLASAYTGLLGMSVADLKGVTNLSNNIGAIYGSSIISSSAAINETRNQINSNLVANTLVSERINNVFENAKYSFGQEMATDASKYLTFKISKFTMDLMDDFGKQLESSNSKHRSALLAAVNATKTVAGIALFGSVLSDVLSLGSSLDTINSSSVGLLADMIGNVSYSTSGGDGVSTAGLIALGANAARNTAFKSITENAAVKAKKAQFTELYGDESTWSVESEDETAAALKNLESTIMQDKEGGKAIAVFMQGMSDATLRSFASIFADEDSMEDTFNGKNNALKDNLFEYADDTTSSSTKSQI